MHRAFWAVQSLIKAEAAGAPNRLRPRSNLLEWNSGVPDGLHHSSDPFGWIGHPRSHLLEWPQAHPRRPRAALPQRLEDVRQRAFDAGKNWDIPQRVTAGRAFPQLHDQGLESLGMIGEERDDKLLVVEAK